MKKNKKPSPPKSGQTLRSRHTLIARIAFCKVFLPFPKSHSVQANASSLASVGNATGARMASRRPSRRSSWGWNVSVLFNSNIASLKEQSAWGPWVVLLDLAEKELHSWVWGSGMKRAGPESMGVVQCSQGGSWQRQCAVLVPVFSWASPTVLAIKQQKPKRHSFIMSLRLWWKPSGSFPGGFTAVVLQSFLSTFPSLTSGLGTLNHWKSHLHNSIRR